MKISFETNCFWNISSNLCLIKKSIVYRMADPRLRQITIKTGVVKRLTKEKTVCEKEIDQQKVRIERLKAEGKDEYVMRKEDEILQETLMMVPDAHRR